MEDTNQGIDPAQLLERVRPHARLAGETTIVELDSDLYELGLDSTGAMSLLLDLEEAYGVQFPDSLLTEETFRTANALREALMSLGAR